jgi:hypothetical protein
MIFEGLCIVHVLIWVFVLFAFLNKKWAFYNIYFVIPFIYIIHLLPFHILVALKEKTDPTNHENHEKSFYKTLVIPHLFRKAQKYLEECCLESPISTQGMLIFGLITSIFALYPPTFGKK